MAQPCCERVAQGAEARAEVVRVVGDVAEARALLFDESSLLVNRRDNFAAVPFAEGQEQALDHGRAAYYPAVSRAESFYATGGER